MYCSNCGTKNEGNKFCTKCGNRLDNVVNKSNENVMVKKENSGLKTASIVLGILGIVGSLMIIFSPISFILSLVGLILSIVASKKVKNVSGIVLSSVGLFLSIIIIGIIGLVLIFTSNGYENDYDYYDDYYDDNAYYERFKDIIEEY